LQNFKLKNVISIIFIFFWWIFAPWSQKYIIHWHWYKGIFWKKYTKVATFWGRGKKKKKKLEIAYFRQWVPPVGLCGTRQDFKECLLSFYPNLAHSSCGWKSVYLLDTVISSGWYCNTYLGGFGTNYIIFNFVEIFRKKKTLCQKTWKFNKGSRTDLNPLKPCTPNSD